MSDRASSPAPLSDDELHETLDLLSTVVASVSDRVDATGKAIDRLTKTAAETRQAAFAAKAQTDPEAYGKEIVRIFDGHLREVLRPIVEIGQHLSDERYAILHALRTVREDSNEHLDRIRTEHARLQRWTSRLPWFGLGALVLVLVLSVTLPRFLASYPSTCAVLGASWTTTTTGVDACVFYWQ